MSKEAETAPRRQDPFLPADEDARLLARRLLHEARHAALASVELPGAQPLATRVGLATAATGDALLLLSDLSEHTRALRGHPLCSLLVGPATHGDALREPRLTLRCNAERLERGSAGDGAARARYLARLPRAAAYADFADFAFYRLRIGTAILNGGFARAFRLDRSDLCRDIVADLLDREHAVIRHMNDDHSDSLAAIVRQRGVSRADRWRIVTLDPLGFEATGEETGDLLRIEFAAPVTAPDGYRAAFVHLARRASAPG